MRRKSKRSGFGSIYCRNRNYAQILVSQAALDLYDLQSDLKSVMDKQVRLLSLYALIYTIYSFTQMHVLISACIDVCVALFVGCKMI